MLLDLVAEISRFFRVDKLCVQVAYINDVLQNPNNLSNGRGNLFSDFPFDRLPLIELTQSGGPEFSQFKTKAS
jgi:hypothetical protein